MESNDNWINLKRRYIGLDIFRIVSVIAVCAFHTTIHLGADYAFLQSMSNMGTVFMTAFFMLSGYSLFVNYSCKNEINLKNLKVFYIKRIIGILPMYYIASILYIPFHYLSNSLFGLGKYSLINELILFPVELLGIQSNFHSIFGYSHNGGTWFISCILMCYLIYPFIQEVVKQISVKTKIVIALIATFILFYSPFIEYAFNTVSIYANPFFRILEFLIGIILASLKPNLDNVQFVKRWIYHWWFALLINVVMIIGVSLAVYLNISVGNYMLYSWICLPCFALMLISLSGVDSNVLIKSKFIKYCSGICYVFFLAQLFSNTICKFIISRLTITNNFLIIILGWSICIIIAILLHEVFEKPVKKYLMKKSFKAD